ncbi:MAG: hypothetical protein FJ319_09435 [SAR202 cluster bacterium]|nr:hypothetical protein [SAR202 cluster bacterium]
MAKRQAEVRKAIGYMTFNAPMVGLFVAVMFMLSGCSADRATPLLQQTDFPTPTPRSEASGATGAAATPEPTSAAADHFGFEYKGTVRFAEWENGAVQLANQILGYVLVQGYLYKAETVPVTDGDFRTALESGAVDAVLVASRVEQKEWYDRVIAAGTATDVGSVYGPESDIRVLVRPELTRASPEIAPVFANFSPGEQKITDLSAQISGGRTGLKPNVVAQIYFKQNRDQWAAWLPAQVAADVDAAIEAGRNGFFRQCILVGGGAQGGYSFCK